ncbi:MAG TPA: outer membrane beta-barrel protein [Ignavibacteria bacterium]|nr:outer membrane beta-barrel protein [Ignavibacteria bacterium]
MKKIFILTFILAANISYAQIFTYDNLELGLNIDAYYAKNSIGKEVSSQFLDEANSYLDYYLNSYNYTTPIQDRIRLYNASLTARYSDEDIKGVATLQYGDIIEDYYYPYYPYFERNDYIREANAGFSPVDDLWIEGGIFFQPFSAEPVLPGKNFLTSTAIQSGVEPFKMNALKISYEFINNLSAGFILSEGYSEGQTVEKNKSFGFMIDYSPMENLNIKINNLTGNVYHFYIESWDPYIDFDSRKVLRFFNNAIITYDFNERLQFISGIDFIVQEKSNLYVFDKSVSMYSGFISGRYKINDKLSISGRMEYLNDKHGIFTFAGYFIDYFPYPTGMEAGAFAFGIQYSPKPQLYARLEMNYMDIYQRLGLNYSSYRNGYSKFTGIASMGLNF